MITIYEPIYRDGQTLTETAFQPLVITDNSQAAWREFRIMVDFYRAGRHRGTGKTGIFSPKFGLKTRISGEQFMRFAEQDADVCLVNPFPHLPYFSFNVWMQGEIAHLGLTETAQQLLHASGVDIDLAQTLRHNHANLCYSNFWVGAEEFWDRYIGGMLEPIARYLETHPESHAARATMGGTRHTDHAPYLPFITERLFSTFISMNPDLKVAAYPLTPIDYCLNDFERDIVGYMQSEVDAADTAGEWSPELVRKMALLCGLCQRYGMAHWAANAHPHSGRTVEA